MNMGNQQIDEIEKIKKRSSIISAQILFNQYVNSLLSNEGNESKNTIQNSSKAIFESLDSVLVGSNAVSMQVEIPKGLKLYRARKIEDFTKAKKEGVSISLTEDITKGYDESGSREAPLRLTSDGRNNIAGMSYLYLADTPETACAEVKPIYHSVISLAEFESNRQLRLLDLSEDSNHLNEPSFPIPTGQGKQISVSIEEVMRLISYMMTIPPMKGIGYSFTQVVSDYIRKSGLDGVVYRSNYTGGKNYTIFNSHPSFIKYNGSRLIISESIAYTFWDFNDKKKLYAENRALYMDEQTAKDILRRIEEV